MGTKYLFGLALLLLALALLVVTSVALAPGLAIKGKRTPAQFVGAPGLPVIEAGTLAHVEPARNPAEPAGGLANRPAEGI